MTEWSETFAGILAHLGWGKKYELKQLYAVVEEYLVGSEVAPEDRRAVHSNFIHTSIDHGDVLRAQYGCRAILAYADEDEEVPTIMYLPQ